MSLRRLARSPSSRSLCAPRSFSFSTSASPPPRAPVPASPSYLAHHLLDEFSRPRATRDAARLRRLAAELTAPAAESVLLRLPSWRHALDFFRWAADQPGFRHSCYSLNAMASLLPRHQRAHLDRLAADAISARCLMTPGALGFLLRCLGAAGLPDTAVRAFDAARASFGCTPNSYTYNCLLDALAKAGRADDAQARLREMVARCGDGSVDKYTLTSLLRCYCNAGRPDDANDVFQRMSELGWVDEHVLTTLMVAFSKWGKVDGAVELLGSMEALGMRLSEKTLSVLVHGFTKQGRVDKAMDMFAKMVSYGFVVDLAMYSVLIEGLCQQKDIARAVKLFKEMKSSGVAPDVRLLKKVIEAFCREGDFAVIGPFINENAEYLKSGSVVPLYNVVLEELVHCGEVEAAYQLLRSMVCGGQAVNNDVAGGAHMLHIREDAKPNSDSFNIVVCGLCKVKKLDMALALTKDMISLGCKGKILMFNDLIHELCNMDRLEEGYGIFNQMKDLGLTPSEFTYNSLFYGICRRKDPKAALDLLREMQTNGHPPWIKNCTEMVQQLCFSGRVTEAVQFLDGMLQIGFLPDIVTYSAAMNGMCNTGEVDDALHLFRDISCKYYLPDVVAHNILINGFRKSSKLDEAQKIMEEMLEKGLFPSVVTYNLMIDVCCKTGRIEKAISYLDKMVYEEKQPTVITYTSLIDGFCSAGRPDEAIKLWCEMREKGCAPNNIAYTAFINGLRKCGRIETALTYFEEMVTKGFELDTFSLLYFINFLISNGYPMKGCELLKEVLQKDTYGNNLKMVGLINEAVVELSKDGITSSDILKFVDKGSVDCSLLLSTCPSASCNYFPAAYTGVNSVVPGLEARGNWRWALSVTEWVYKENIYEHGKSRYICDFLQELSENDEKIKSLVSMGFPEDEAKTAITRCGNVYSANLSDYEDAEFSSFGGRKNTRFMDGSKKKSGMEVGHKGIKCHLVTAMKSQCLCQILWWIGVWTTISRFLFDIQPEFVGSFCAAARKMDYIHNLPIENRSPVLPLPPNTISEAFLPTNMWWPSRSKKTVQLLAILRGKREAYRTLCSC
ncbi:Os05g0313900 [Oryza sativa Japonica Group]|uniref:Os05g0313900 protein n=1 Tax=Oryza sativa subsp. japonica TaxID=39947 RepID=C7J306_ORYSJ|nr:Os05g0313900 [Oryza sativa Japonica Group]|eukprot:NP_001174341.1 Os05g0313900 [Oryza sativa Japonica Group]